MEYFPNQVMAESTDFDLKIIFLDDLTKIKMIPWIGLICSSLIVAELQGTWGDNEGSDEEEAEVTRYPC